MRWWRRRGDHVRSMYRGRGGEGEGEGEAGLGELTTAFSAPPPPPPSTLSSTCSPRSAMGTYARMVEYFTNHVRDCSRSSGGWGRGEWLVSMLYCPLLLLSVRKLPLFSFGVGCCSSFSSPSFASASLFMFLS